MGILGKVKGLVKGNKSKAKQGVDKAADVVEHKVGGDNAAKVEAAAEKVKEAIDKLD